MGGTKFARAFAKHKSASHGGIDREPCTKVWSTRLCYHLMDIPSERRGSLRNGKQEWKELIDWMMPLFEEETSTNCKNKPHHLLGIADKESVCNAVMRGIDIVPHSCYPTRVASQACHCSN
jgi:hypothetical protein